MQQAAAKPSPLIVGPVCAVCDENMLLARVTPFEDEQELHIFECPVCKQSQSEIAKFG